MVEDDWWETFLNEQEVTCPYCFRSSHPDDWRLLALIELPPDPSVAGYVLCGCAEIFVALNDAAGTRRMTILERLAALREPRVRALRRELRRSDDEDP